MRAFHILLIPFFFIAASNLDAQNSLCSTAYPFCTDTIYLFPAGVNAGTAEDGPNYGCLYTQPNPAWYYMQVLDPGDIIIYMTSTPQVDIDFALWGPFNSQSTPCLAGLTAECTYCPDNTTSPSFYPSGNLVDCSYSTHWSETAHIYGAQTDEIYLLLITNYSNQPCNINFFQQNAGAPGAGSTNCGILAAPVDNNGPLCVGETLLLTAQNGPENCIYYWTGPNGFESTLQNPFIEQVGLQHAGVYNMRIIVNADTSNVVSTQVHVNAIPDASFTVSSQTVCAETIIELNYTGGAASSANYQWDVDGGLPSPLTGPGPHNLRWNSQGDKLLSLVVSDDGCTSPPASIPIQVKKNAHIRIYCQSGKCMPWFQHYIKLQWERST
jgi:hypothetical protein